MFLQRSRLAPPNVHGATTARPSRCATRGTPNTFGRLLPRRGNRRREPPQSGRPEHASPSTPHTVDQENSKGVFNLSRALKYSGLRLM